MTNAKYEVTLKLTRIDNGNQEDICEQSELDAIYVREIADLTGAAVELIESSLEVTEDA